MFGRKIKGQNVSLDMDDANIEEGHCFISGNVAISGEVRFAGTLRVDGRVDGRVTNYTGKKGTLILSKGSIINGPVETTNLITDGEIHGDVNIKDTLECRASSIIDGEIYYGKLQIAEGAQLRGRCTQRSKDDNFTLAPAITAPTSKRGPKKVTLATKASESPMGFLRKPRMSQ